MKFSIQWAFTRLELVVMLTVATVIILGVLFPSMAKAKEKRCLIKDTSNIKNIALAFRIFATDHDDRFPSSHKLFQDSIRKFGDDASQTFRHFVALSNELSTPKILVSPIEDPSPRIVANSFYELKSNRNISYFVGLDADETQPQSILTGSRWLTNSVRSTIFEAKVLTFDKDTDPEEIRSLNWALGGGNVALGDGSVQGANQKMLQRCMKDSKNSGTTNRLSLPD